MNSGSLVGREPLRVAKVAGVEGAFPSDFSRPDEGSASYLDIEVRALPGLEAHAGA